ncbi:hypothetical protein SELMODRAFT_114689 [Selaginella moellendorffii]|uniref:Xaa-Pro dipeptidase n=1 Tax=Selaginella moellendorffii TaxID=88036 RepID=D8SE33_SELML|nr:hypothetical protein SELMODRAFT_114689 [Selaginella moellendorffii]
MARHRPPSFSMLREMHVHNRKKLQNAMAEKLESIGQRLAGVVLLQGGEERYRDCTDHLELFRQESFFAYLFGVREPGFYAAIDIATGQSILFVPRLDPDYAVWLGEIHPPSFFKEKYGVDAAYYVDEMVSVLRKFDASLYLLHGLNTDSNRYCKPATFQGIEGFEQDTKVLHPVLSECRVIKSELELELLRYVNEVSSAAHVKVMRSAQPGLKEYQLESTFQHYCYMEGGCRECSYTCICATGENRQEVLSFSLNTFLVFLYSAVLHYGHAAAPNDQIASDGAMALLDMGAEYHFYGSDITCSFPVNGKFTEKQRLIYTGVLEAQKAVISKMKPGISWVAMHKLAETKILEALKTAGCLKGNVEDMMENRLGAVFMPHGLGHFLGLDTHDPGGYPQGMSRINERGLVSLRTVRTLEAGMLITVEPGCYFIDAVLDPALEDPVLSRFLNREAIDKFRGFGGVRLEDDVIVTSDGCENLTNCPREISDVEDVMAGGPWPRT